MDFTKQFTAIAPWGPIPTAPKGHTWESLMQKALLMAQKAMSCGEVPIGALVVDKEGTILSCSHNQSIQDNDPTAHAEIVAIRAAAKIKQNYRLVDCFLIVTLEPCSMCMGAIREARLAGVCFGAYDKRAGAICSCYEGLNCPELGVKTWHYGGILADEAIKILQEFFKDRR